MDEIASLHLNLETESRVAIRIFNLAGREVLNLGTQTLPAGQHVREIPTGDFPSGIYLLRTAISGEIYTSKMMVR